ncbi:MAG TPA: hypothetical protein VK540_07150 [Polyangiaceae bacterium]|nr:hypothetical protein [Polyangiaceae bacterium]
MSIARLQIARRFENRPLRWGIVASVIVVPFGAIAQTPPVTPEPPPPTTVPAAQTQGSPGATEPAAGATSPSPALPPAIAPLPPAPAPIAAKPSPFTFALHGFVSGGIYLQDAAFASGQGGGAIFGPNKLDSDRWFLGGDVRQTQLKFTVKGPEVLGGASPMAVVELDLLGGNQVTTVPGPTAIVRDAMGMPIGTVGNTATSVATGDESVLPRLRLAYAELNWGEGTDMLRVGQQHNLLVYMIPASASHIGVPLGYGAGQLGWRTPGITYLHKFALPDDMRVDLHLQVNRNSWIDNYPVCAATQIPPAAGANCLPSGISLGEASTLPQLEARVVFSTGKKPSPWPYYPASDFTVYAIGHWDQKDLSGVGASAPSGDTLTTLIGDLGFKAALGPAIIAGNAWYGKNAGAVYGNMIQMQAPNGPDVTGFGAWGQLGFSITKELSVWAFGGIDQPTESQAIAANFTRLQNVQAAGQIAYKDGPYAIGLELLHIWTKNYVPGTAMTAASTTTLEGNQPMATVDYFF